MGAALALVDGEHYPAVVRDALAELPYDIEGVVLVGGEEKLTGEPDYGVPLYSALGEALEALGSEIVLDLSDEPVLGPAERFRLASRALAAGARYVGADFHFEPVRFAPFPLPSLAIIGTGKRVGKTAVAGHLARLLAHDRPGVVIVAMGRGGPAQPVVVDAPPDLAGLLARERAGEHAASDYLEDAVLASVVTIGCRRCGGGLAGAPFVSNVDEGARLAEKLGPELVVFEGSGAAIPPVEARRVLVAGAAQGPDALAGYLGPYRLLLSDLVVVTGCEEPLASPADLGRVRAAVAETDAALPVVGTVLRPRPAEPIAGQRIAYFSTAPAAIHARLRTHLEQAHGAEVVLVSGSLGRRRELAAELESSAARAADAYVVELKAAAIEVVARAAEARGVRVVFADNEVVPLDDEPDLDGLLLALAETACAEAVR